MFLRALERILSDTLVRLERYTSEVSFLLNFFFLKMSGEEEQQLDGREKFLLDAFNAQMARLLRENNEALHERIEHLEGLIHQGDGRRDGGGPRPNHLKGVKLNIPPFKGRSDPDAYLEWELKIEHIFSCHNYDDATKVKITAAEFSDYALIWWNKLQKERARNEEPLVGSWEEMKRIMRRRYVPSHYTRDLKIKLQKLSQGSKSVEEYYKEMEILMMQAKVEEDDEVTMARFLNGLENDIREVVELQEYVEMGDLLHKAIQVEQQLKRKRVAKRSSYNQGTSWKDKEKVAATPSKVAPTPSKPSPNSSQESSKRSRDVKCFRCQGLGHYAYECPNKKTMVIKGGEVVSEDEKDDDDDDEGSEEFHEPEEELLMIRRLLNSQLKPMEECQRENIFHTRCLINGKLCILIIDGGSCTNVASERIVSKLNLVTKPHPKPYKLQ